jgi:hypothetical protein
LAFLGKVENDNLDRIEKEREIIFNNEDEMPLSPLVWHLLATATTTSSFSESMTHDHGVL